MSPLVAIALSAALHFEPNVGQAPKSVRYVGFNGNLVVWLSDSEIQARPRVGPAVRMHFPPAVLEPLDRLTGVSNYAAIQDLESSSNGVPRYARIRYRSVFPGIDLLAYSHSGKFEYDWVISPHADPASIHFTFAGDTNSRLTRDGKLMVGKQEHKVTQEAPLAYQVSNGVRLPVRSRFLLSKTGVVRFRVRSYRADLPLIIDPTFVFSTGIGGSQATFVGAAHGSAGLPYTDDVTSIGLDGAGNIYIAGHAFSQGFPVTNQKSFLEPILYVAKLSPDGSTILYSSYIQANPCCSSISTILPFSMAVALDGTVYVTAGTTDTSSLQGNSNVLVAKLDSAGVLKGFAEFGGSGYDAGESIALGTDGSVYVSGITSSPEFVYSPNAYQASSKGIFLMKIDPTKLFSNAPDPSAVIYSAAIGSGSGTHIAVDRLGGVSLVATTAQVTGWAPSAAALQPVCAGGGGTSLPCGDVVVLRVNSTGTALSGMTFLGGSGIDSASGIALDAAGNLYLSGITTSPDFPLTSGAIQTAANSGNASSGFLAQLTPDLSKLTYSTYLAGTPTGLALDTAGIVFLTGSIATDINLPILSAIQSAPYRPICGGYMSSYNPFLMLGGYYCQNPGFVQAVDTVSGHLLWSTYLGGGTNNGLLLNTSSGNANISAIAVDAAGNVYAAGNNRALTTAAANGSPSNSAGIVKIAPGGTPPRIYGILNSAGFQPGLPAPGGLASLFVTGLQSAGTVVAPLPLPTQLSGVIVLVDGIPAPILSVSALPRNTDVAGMQQINFQVPFEVPQNLQLLPRVVELRFNGQSAFAEPQYVAPGLFTTADGGPVIQHAADYSLVTPANPVNRGETVIVYATGLGPVSPSVPSGSGSSTSASLLPGCGSLTVSMGDVLYAGLTPGFPGLYQINVKVAQTLASGNATLFVDRPSCWMGTPLTGFSRSNSVLVPVQ